MSLVRSSSLNRAASVGSATSRKERKFMDETAISKSKQEALARELRTVDAVIERIAAAGLGPEEGILYVLRHSVDVQRIATLQQMAVHVRPGSAPLTTMLISLCATIAGYSGPVQVACATGLTALFPLLAPDAQLALFGRVRATLFSIDEGVFAEWAALYFCGMRLMTADTLRREVVPFLSSLATTDRSVSERAFACELLAELIKVLPDDAWSLLPVAQQLAADTSAAVRQVLAERMWVILAPLPAVCVREQCTLNPISVLLLDPSPAVSAAVFEQLVHLIAASDEGFVADFLFPVMLRFTLNAPQAVQDTALAGFGKLVWAARECIVASNTLETVASLYVHMSRSPSEHTRRHCAFNFPALLATFQGHAALQRRVLALLKAFSTDTSVTVRRSIAAGYHALFGLVPSSPTDKTPEMAVLEEGAVRLMGDADLAVRERVFNHVGVFLKAFFDMHAGKPAEQQAALARVIPPLIRYEQAVTNNWRKLEGLLRYFPTLPAYYPLEVLERDLVPVLVGHLVHGANTLSAAIAQTIATFLHACGTREDCILVSRTVQGLARTLTGAASCKSKAAYIALVGGMLGVFSCAFVHGMLLRPLLSLLTDPVPTVRARLVGVLPLLLCKPPLRATIARHFLEPLTKDTDPIVRAKAAAISSTVEEICAAAPFDAARDKRLAEEEHLLLSADIIAVGAQVTSPPTTPPHQGKRQKANR